MGYVWRKCRLAWHSLTEGQRLQRLQQNQLLLATLCRGESTGWHFSQPGMSPGSFTTCSIVYALELSRRLIGTPKLMVTIFWGISGIHVIEYLSPGSSFESAYFVDHLLNSFQTLPALLLAKRNRKSFVIHIGNSSIHNSQSVPT
jgi:hypothetical protein